MLLLPMRNLMALLLLFVACTPARSVSVRDVGTRVRVVVGSDSVPLAGRVAAVQPDTLVLRREPTLVARPIPADSILSLELRGGRGAWEGLWHGAKWGAGMGGVSMALFSLVYSAQIGGLEGGWEIIVAGMSAGIGAAGGALYGGIIGGVLGHLRWRPATLP